MRIFTPTEVATHAGNKYLGVLVAAKFARYVNEFPRAESHEIEKKITTQALEQLTLGNLAFRLTTRRPADL